MFDLFQCTVSGLALLVWVHAVLSSILSGKFLEHLDPYCATSSTWLVRNEKVYCSLDSIARLLRTSKVCSLVDRCAIPV